MNRVAFVACVAVGLAGTLLANPFDDVKYMFSGGVDADGNGVLTHNSSELRCITKAGDPTHAWHTTTYPDSNLPLFRLQNLDVPCTYANMTLANVPCLVMPQPVTTNGWEEITVNGNTFDSPNVTVKANYLKLPDLLSDWTGDRANMSCSNYTFIARFRRDEAVADHLNLMSDFFMPGYDWGTQKGISVIFMGQTGAKTRYLQIKGGKDDRRQPRREAAFRDGAHGRRLRAGLVPRRRLAHHRVPPHGHGGRRLRDRRVRDPRLVAGGL